MNVQTEKEPKMIAKLCKCYHMTESFFILLLVIFILKTFDFANPFQDRHQKPAQVMVFVNVPMMILLANGDLSCHTQGFTGPYDLRV